MKTRTLLVWTWMAALAPLSACGGDDDGVTCGPGTSEEDGECVADDGSGVECGDGTAEVDGVCVADDPACGPGTVLDGDSCVVDRSAPGPVQGFVATASDDTISLDWTAGAGATGTLVARLVAGGDDAPVPGTVYDVGDTLPGGAEVVAVGGTSADDAVTVPGRYTYLAWSVNASGNFGFGRDAMAEVDPGAQEATLSIVTATDTGSVTAQPSALSLAVDNVAFVGAEVTFDLTLTNDTAGQWFNAKAIVHSASVGALQDTAGDIDGDPFYRLGFGGILPGDSVTQQVRIDGLLVTDVVGLEVEVVESDLSILGMNGVDLGGGDPIDISVPSVRGSNQEISLFTAGRFSTTGRYYYGLSRWTTGVYRLDTTNGDATAITPLTVGTGNGTCLVVGDDGFAYAAFGLGSHRRNEGNGVGIAKVDLASMTTVATTMAFFEEEAQAQGCALHETTLAVAYGTQVLFADTETMELEDLDGETDELEGVETGAGDYLRTLVFDPDGSRVFATTRRNDTNIYVIDTALRESAIYHTSTTTRFWSLRLDADGTLWWGHSAGISSFDGATEAAVPVLTAGVRALFAMSATTAFASFNGSIGTIDLTGGTTVVTGSIDDNDRMGHDPVVFHTD